MVAAKKRGQAHGKPAPFPRQPDHIYKEWSGTRDNIILNLLIATRSWGGLVPRGVAHPLWQRLTI